MLLDASATRAAEIDRQLREQLSNSLDYLAQHLACDGWSLPEDLPASSTALLAGPISPWVFGFYALVAQCASRGELEEARRHFTLLSDELATPSRTFITDLSDPCFSDDHRSATRILLNTDYTREFLPQAPDPDTAESCSRRVEEALSLLQAADPDAYAETRQLIRHIILAVPGDASPEQAFNGASTFFLWGATLLNAAVQRSVVATVEALVHEASHLLLFGLVSGGALSENNPETLYTSPVRRDPRPIDGIFHAAFVTSRVHQSMTHLRKSKALPVGLLPAVEQCAKKNADAAGEALGLLQQELKPTAAGLDILDALIAYWEPRNDWAA